ncbi:MAG: zinc ribbon domain-containing protein [Proteobacteria bacterium]|nr:zinc ribbon domain-containing protein [Pseudomonadota bacterium]
MPIFEYTCDHCGHQFEKLVFKSDEDQVSCPKCNQKKTKKVISATRMITGSGKGCGDGAAKGGFS